MTTSIQSRVIHPAYDETAAASLPVLLESQA
jgi:hypothetical protein